MATTSYANTNSANPKFYKDELIANLWTWENLQSGKLRRIDCISDTSKIIGMSDYFVERYSRNGGYSSTVIGTNISTKFLDYNYVHNDSANDYDRAFPMAMSDIVKGDYSDEYRRLIIRPYSNASLSDGLGFLLRCLNVNIDNTSDILINSKYYGLITEDEVPNEEYLYNDLSVEQYTKILKRFLDCKVEKYFSNSSTSFFAYENNADYERQYIGDMTYFEYINTTSYGVEPRLCNAYYCLNGVEPGKSFTGRFEDGVIMECDIKTILSYLNINIDETCDTKTGDITFKTDNTDIKMRIGSTTAYVNGIETTLSKAPYEIYYYYVPIKDVATLLGLNSNFDKYTGTLYINNK